MSRRRKRRRPAVSVDVLLNDADLGLSLRTTPASPEKLQVEWTATSELVDPTPFLEGREILLTTGAQLDADDEEATGAYFERLTTRGIGVIGFGIGLRHHDVPDTVIRYAAQFGIALIEVPLETPFVAISRLVANKIAEQEYQALSHALAIQDQLVQALTDGAGLHTMLVSLSEVVSAPCAVMDFYGTILAEAPETLTWPLELVLERRLETESWGLGDLSAYPVVLEGRPIATLLTRATDQHEQSVLYARGLVAIELAKRSEILVARRQSLGLMLEDVLQGLLRGREAELRAERFGIDLASPNTVVIARTSASSNALLRTPWDLQSHLMLNKPGARLVVAIANDELVVIQPATMDAAQTAKRLGERLGYFKGPVSIGTGGSYPGLEGLLLSHAEASAAARRGTGINIGGRMRLVDIMVATAVPGIRDLANDLLSPLHNHDRSNGGELVDTLRIFLEEGASTLRTAERMFVHRNTIGQRIRRIRDLTGLDPTQPPHAAELWLALAHRRHDQ